MKILVTGGAGFIGSHFIRTVLAGHPEDSIINLDKLTYAGNLANLKDVDSDPRYQFVRGDICDGPLLDTLLPGVDAVVNFAAETHVDRSIHDAGEFIQTNVYGTYVLLEAARRHLIKRYLQISTDEVYGSIEKGKFSEASPLHPNSPYAAAKAAADLLVQSFGRTYHLPVLITRSSNNFGPNQYPEKVIPLFITNALEDKPLPLYGDGLNVRDWIYVNDNCAGIDLVLRKGTPGDVYNLGGGTEQTNIALAKMIVRFVGKPESLIQPVKDRLGHDRRYALEFHKAAALGYKPARPFDEALRGTVDWYTKNQEWWRAVKSGDFKT